MTVRGLCARESTNPPISSFSPKAETELGRLNPSRGPLRGFALCIWNGLTNKRFQHITFSSSPRGVGYQREGACQLSKSLLQGLRWNYQTLWYSLEVPIPLGWMNWRCRRDPWPGFYLRERKLCMKKIDCSGWCLGFPRAKNISIIRTWNRWLIMTSVQGRQRSGRKSVQIRESLHRFNGNCRLTMMMRRITFEHQSCRKKL